MFVPLSFLPVFIIMALAVFFLPFVFLILANISIFYCLVICKKNDNYILVTILTKRAQPAAHHGTKIFKYCTCPAGRVTYNFHSSCKHMHLSFKSVCNKENKGVICNRTSSSSSSQSTHPTGQVLGKNYLSYLDSTCNY